MGVTRKLTVLSEMAHGQEADLFVLMTIKEELNTREGKPYFKVGFRDHAREVSFPIWGDSPWGVDCREQWKPGAFYKMRALYRDTNFGPQLEIRKIRAVVEADEAEGFSPAMCQPQSRFDRRAMFAELLSIAEQKIDDPAARPGCRSAHAASRGAARHCRRPPTTITHLWAVGWSTCSSVTRTVFFWPINTTS